MIKIFQNKKEKEVRDNSLIITSSFEALEYKKKYLNNNLKVCSFKNLINSLIVKCTDKKIVTSEESYLFMYLAFNKVKDRLMVYNNITNYEFYNLLINTYEFYKKHTCEENDKIKDLSLIYDTYDKLLKENNLISLYNAIIESIGYIKNIKEDNIYFINVKELDDNQIYFIKKLGEEKNVYLYANTINNNSLIKSLNKIDSIAYEETENENVNNLYKIGSNNLFNNANITSCNDLYEEVWYVYEDIKSKINGGLKYKDILIVSPDKKRYDYYFDMIFDIPYTKESIYGILTKNFINILNSILNGNFTCSNFISLIKLGIYNIDEKIINDLDNYIYSFSLEDALFYDEFKFNPAGKKEFSSSDYEKLKTLNETRLSILNSFKYLLENTINVKNAKENLKYLFMYLEEEKIIDKLCLLDSEGYNKLIDDLELVNDFIKEASLSEILNIINSMYKEFSKKNFTKDEIMITDSSNYYDKDFKMVYFIGLTEKDIPAAFSFNTLINDNDLKEEDIFDLINSFNDLQKNNISNILLNKNITITYHKLTDAPSKVDKSPLLLKFSSKINSYTYNLNKKDDKNFNLSIPSNLALELYGKDLFLSPSSLEMFSKCKYSYFLNYGLKLKIKEKYDFDNREVGTFIHFILENILKNYKEKIDDSLIKSLIDKYSTLYFSLNVRNVTNSLKYIIDVLKESTYILVKTIFLELDNTKFSPFCTEFKIKDLDYKIKLNNGMLYITGIIDRIDSYFDDNNYYFRIIDYKTGTKKFRLDDILLGLNMQMIVYLLAIKNGLKINKNIIPTGFLYYPALVHYKKENIGTKEDIINDNLISSLKMNGILNKDFLSLYDDEKIGNFIDVKTRGNINDEKVLDSKDLSLVFKKIEKILKEEGENILSGDIKINPIIDYKNDSCKYCKFSSICNFNPSCDIHRKYKSLKKREVLLSIEGDLNGLDK